MTHAPPPGGRAMYCPCGNFWASVHGPRPLTDHAACIVSAIGLTRVPCLSCGGTIAAIPASSEARR